MITIIIKDIVIKGGNGGKRIYIYIALILPDLGYYRLLLVKLHRNS